MAEPKNVKIKKKHWVTILAPKSFNNAFLGETPIDETQKAIGKSVTMNLMVLTDDPRKQGYTLRFDVTSVKEGKAHTQAIGIEMTPSAIKRLMRRHRDKISDSFIMRTGGGRLVRVKPVLVTKTKCSRTAQTDIRKKTRELLKEQWQRLRFDDIVLDIADGKTTRLLRDVCSKTHPIRSADIKEAIILPEGRAMTKEMEALLEQEAGEEEAKRQQLQAAAQAASVSEEMPAVPKKRVLRKKTEETQADE